MEPVIHHPWPRNEIEAIQLQHQLASRVISADPTHAISLVAGVDVAYDPHSEKTVAAVVVLEAKTLQLVAITTAVDTASFPYIPGLFSFRELPVIVKAIQQLNISPDIIVCDGQGIAHPRRFGLACHLGVLFDIPAIGCGKTRLTGEAVEPGNERGSHTPLIDGDEIIGSVLRTQTGIKPVYVSIGHRISLATARDWILTLSPRYRLPETTRQADQAVRRAMAQK